MLINKWNALLTGHVKSRNIAKNNVTAMIKFRNIIFKYTRA